MRFATRAHHLDSPRAAVSVKSPAAPLSVSALTAAHLFGAAPALLGELDHAAATRRVTYQLTGVLATNNPHEGSAILGEKGRPTRLYHTGDSLSSGGRLAQVLVDRVLLEFGDRRETLRLPTRLGGLDSGLPQDAGALEDAPQTPRLAAAKPIDVSTGESLFSGIVAVPYNGAADPNGGMLLRPNRAYQRRYGLRTGDVLTAVNGTTVTNGDALTEALKGAGDSLTLSLIRNGVPQTVGITSQN
jgi:type II secretion system protein C